jgi:hypothetical protein
VIWNKRWSDGEDGPPIGGPPLKARTSRRRPPPAEQLELGNSFHGLFARMVGEGTCLSEVK